MKMSVFGFATTRRFAAIAILASFVFSNVFAVDAIRGDKSNSQKSVAAVKYTTDLTQLGREGRLRENPSYEKETMSLVKALDEGGLCQPVIINEDKAVQEIVVEQLAIMIARGKAPKALAGKSIIKIETDVLFSNARSAADIAKIVDSIVNEAVASKGQTILFINELTNFVGSKASATNFFTAIAAGKLDVIGGSNAVAYDEQIEGQPEIAAYFAGILVTDRNASNVVEENNRREVNSRYRGDNVSSDLREMMAADPTGETRVDVIIQAKDADDRAMRSMVAAGEVGDSKRIGNTDTVVANLPLSTVSELSNSGTINYISPRS